MLIAYKLSNIDQAVPLDFSWMHIYCEWMIIVVFAAADARLTFKQVPIPMSHLAEAADRSSSQNSPSAQHHAYFWTQYYISTQLSLVVWIGT